MQYKQTYTNFSHISIVNYSSRMVVKMNMFIHYYYLFLIYDNLIAFSYIVVIADYTIMPISVTAELLNIQNLLCSA